MADDDRLYIRQLLSGRDFAAGNPVAKQMVNFAYVIGDREKGEALIVDPAYAAGDLIDLVEAEGMRVVGALATHHHPDHVGGTMMGHTLEGVAELVGRGAGPVHVHRAEAPFVQRVTGIDASDLVEHDSGDTVTVGDISITVLHTPGHTPGSMCFLVGNVLVSGDTLFLEGCGRTDLPGGDAAQLYESLTTKLAKVPDHAVLFPGHLYSAEPSATMEETRRFNFVFTPRSEAEWMAMFGR